MIHSIKSDKPSFKTVDLKDGLNVILATRTQKSDRKDSTNGLGKSTILDILHFCLGGDRSGVLNNTILDDWTFTVTLDIGDDIYSISRTTKNRAKIQIVGDCSKWPIIPKITDRKRMITCVAWKKTLGAMMYGLDIDKDVKFAPTFRSLFSYFARRTNHGGYSDPFMHNSRQLTWDIQVNNAYLLGLDWNLASQKQVLRETEYDLKQTRKSTEVTLKDSLDDGAELEATRIRLEDEIKTEKEHIDNFRVHKTYGSLEENVNKITKEMHHMLNLNVADRRLLDLYQTSVVEETDADPEQISQIYKEAGLLFPDVVTKRLEDVKNFHKRLVQNRRDYLHREIDRLKDAVMRRDQKIQEMGEAKTKIMNILKTHGALEEFLKIQENHQNKVATLEDITHRLKIVRDIDDTKDALALESALLTQQIKSDLAEREAQRADAIRAFNLYSRRLYNAPGTLSIGSSSSGYNFGVRIERSDSHGYTNMNIFCYDMTLARLWAHKQTSPGFLVHDSMIFADVDHRQVAHAVQLADAESRKHRYQYICMMNSDSVPWDEFDSDFDFDSHVVLRLTDATEDGSLLGIRF